jgi:hypothetical protein
MHPLAGQPDLFPIRRQQKVVRWIDVPAGRKDTEPSATNSFSY